MAQPTSTRINVDATGDPAMVVFWHSDEQFQAKQNDVAFAPPGLIPVDIPNSELHALDKAYMPHERPILNLIQGHLMSGGHAAQAAIVNARIRVMDAQTQLDADLNILANLVAQFGSNPTPPQLAQINVAQNQVNSDQSQLQTAQSVLNNLLNGP